MSAEEDIPGYLSAVPFDPAGLSDRSAEEIRAASRVVAWRQTQFMFDGMCPACSGVVESKLECCPDHDPAGICEHCGTQFAALARFEWEICKNHNVSSPKALAMFHPAVVGFYETHGISTRSSAVDAESVRRIFELMESHAVDLLDDDPPEVEVIVDLEGDEIRLMFDERAAVVDVNR